MISGRAARTGATCPARGQTDQAAADPQGRLGGQPRRSAHAMIAADDQHMAEMPLVAVALPGPSNPACLGQSIRRADNTLLA